MFKRGFGCYKDLLFPGSFKTGNRSRQYCPQEAVWIQFELRMDVSAICVHHSFSGFVLFMPLVVVKEIFFYSVEEILGRLL